MHDSDEQNDELCDVQAIWETYQPLKNVPAKGNCMLDHGGHCTNLGTSAVVVSLRKETESPEGDKWTCFMLLAIAHSTDSWR